MRCQPQPLLIMSSLQSERSSELLLTDYSRWLNFVLVSRQTIRAYDRQLRQIAYRYTDLSELSNFLRNCMHHRSQFLGEAAIMLTEKVAHLRTEPTNADLIRRMNQAYPAMQALFDQLAEAISEIEESYRKLPIPQSARLRIQRG